MKGASQSFVQKGLKTGHYAGLDGAVVGAAIEEADGIDDFLQALDGSDAREWPTPTASMYRQDVHNSGQYAEDLAEKGRQITLAAAVKLRPDKTWPTPQASGVANDVNVRSATQRSLGSPPNKFGWAVGEAEDGPEGTPSTHLENPAAPERAPQAELELDDLEDFASGRVQWHLVSPSVKMTPGYFPTPTACDAFGNNVDGWSPLGRFIQNNNVRPPRRSKEERDAARANRGPVGQLNPDWVEWLMGWPVGWTSMSPMTAEDAQAYAAGMPGPWWRQEPPHVSRITVGTPDRAGRLKACGNGQVPLCNAAAFEVLLETYRQVGVACAHVSDEELDAFDLLGL
jgi:hypothetical protein